MGGDLIDFVQVDSVAHRNDEQLSIGKQLQEKDKKIYILHSSHMYM